MTGRTYDRVDELLVHAGWLRALARTLVTDAATADDLVQETWVAALAHPPREGAERPWLARVLRNFARQRGRREGRREQHERGSAQPGELPSPAELSERMECQRRLLNSVLELPEPYGSTVVLRYYEGLSASEIARRKGIPHATVRSHIKRGLDSLRERLDREHNGQRNAWTALLLPWATVEGPAPTGLLATITQGVLTVSIGTKLAAITSAVIVLVAIGLLGLGDEDAEMPRTVASPSNAVVAATPDPQEEPAAIVDKSLRESVESVAPTPSSSPVATPRFAIAAVIVDEKLQPLGGMRARLQARAGEELTTESDERGQVHFGFDSEASRTLAVSAEGFATRRLQISPPYAATTDLGQIVMHHGSNVRGRVLGHDGEPREGTRIAIQIVDGEYMLREMGRERGPSQWGGAVYTESDWEGHFEFEDVGPGDQRVWAKTDDSLWAFSSAFDVVAGSDVEDVELRLVPLDPATVLEGLVLAPNGDPIANCTVRCLYRQYGAHNVWFEETDDFGRFETLLPAGVPHDFRADDTEDRWPDAVAMDVTAGTTVVLQFADRPEIEVVVADGDGESVPELRVRAFVGLHTVVVSIGKEHPSEPLRTLVTEPNEEFWVRIEAPGFLSQELGPFAPGSVTEPLHCTLAKSAGLRGRVLDGRSPIEGARVELFGGLFETDTNTAVVHHHGFYTRVSPYDVEYVTTNVDGRFKFAPIESGRYTLRAEVPGRAPAELEVADYDPSIGREGLKLSLGPGGAIEGVVRSSSGDDVAGTLVAVSRGDTRSFQMHVGGDGRFRFEHLIPGPWNVEIIEEGLENVGTSHTIGPAGFEPPWACEVHAGRTTYHDLDLASLSCALRGTLTVDGEPASGWSASLRTLAYSSGRPSLRPQTNLRAEGDFMLAVPRSGSYALMLAAPDLGITLSTSVDLSEGELSWTCAIATGRVEIANASRGTDGSFLMLRWESSGLSSSVTIEPDANRRFTVARFPAGDVWIDRLDPLRRTDPVTVATAVVESGTTTVITLL